MTNIRYVAAAFVVALAGSSVTVAQPVLIGPAAFGDWTTDVPGTRRHIRASDLPPTGESKQNEAEVVPMPAGAMPAVPAGFKVELVTQRLAGPRVIRRAPNGDLFVANSKANEVRVFRVPAGSAKPAAAAVFATGLNKPYGIAFYPPGDSPQWVYVANQDGVVRFPYKSGDLKATGAPEKIIEGLPWVHHWTKDIAFSPDGKRLFVAVGSGSNVALDMTPAPREPKGIEAWAKSHAVGAAWDTEELRANVLSYTPDGKDRVIFATGIRNPAGITFRPGSGELWAAVNERDGLGDDGPFEYVTHVDQNQFYGWPWFYIGANEDGRPASKRPDLKDTIAVPDVMIQAHSAALQIVFYDGDDFPAEYKGSAFVTLHGSWDRGRRTGYKVVRVLFDTAGKATGQYEDFLTGFVVSEKQVWGRPVGVAVGADGSLFVTEDGNGTIWRVSHP